MKSSKTKILALAASAALVAMLGLATTGSSAAGDVNTANMLAYMGASDKGELFYWAVDDTNNEGILAVLDPATGKYASFVGPITSPSDTQITISDESTGMSLTFELIAADKDGNMVIDMGEQGKAVLAACSIDEVLEALKTIAANGTEVNPASSGAAATSASSEAASASSAAASASSVDTSGMEAYMGMSSANEAYYFAIDTNASEGILVIMNQSGQYLSFVGPIAVSGNSMKITDTTTGDSFGFEVTAADNGGVILDAGNAGQIAMAQCSIDEVVQALSAIGAQGTAVN